MIAVVFLLVLIGAMVVAAMMGGGGAAQLPIPELLLLVGVFLLFFSAGIYIAAALGVLALAAGYAFSDRPFWNFLGQMIWGPSSSFVLVAVPLFLLMGELLLRSGLSGATLPGAQRIPAALAGRAATHQHRLLRRVLGHRGFQRRDRGDHGLGRAACIP